MSKRVTSILLIVVSVLLVGTLTVQGLYMAGILNREKTVETQVVTEAEPVTEMSAAAETETTSVVETETVDAPENGADSEIEEDAEATDTSDVETVEVTQPETKSETSKYTLSHDGYTLEQVVVFSRHNIRSPLIRGGSILSTATPHTWFPWSSGASELSLRGGLLETEMGQYFRKWLEKEGLFPENYLPEDGAVRVYANSKQRTIATAEYFASGLLPTANIPVEYHVEFDKMDPVFTPQFTFITPAYQAAVDAQIHELFDEAVAGLVDNYELLSDVIDLQDSQGWKDGSVAPFVTDDLEMTLELDSEPKMTGTLKTACSISDALVLQYYEQADDKLAAFGHDLSFEDWREISEVKDLYGDILFSAPLVAPHVAHPILEEIRAEMTNERRQFTFLCGHDSNVGSILASLGAADYTCPGAIERKTPIGCKIVLAKWLAEDGAEYWSLDLVYQSAEQLRGMPLLDLENPPVVYPIELTGLTRNADGLYDAEALLERFDEAIGEYDELMELYALDVAA